MPNNKKFIIAIGGTGMRCLEAFVHLCAAGLFDDEEIEILTLDTDQSNGNKGRVEDLIDTYNKVKTNDAHNQGGQPRKDTFFSAKLNLYKFWTDYSKPDRKTYDSLAQKTTNLSEAQRQDNHDLADLFYDRDSVQQFELDHGYRAQTHLGSMLMYHGMIEAATNVSRDASKAEDNEKALRDFLTKLNRHANNARVFVFGSVFGGTGASSIPVIPLAIRDSLKVMTDGAIQINLDNVVFGSTLLTDYFSFNSPTSSEREKQKLIADSKNFALNSQAALSFYNGDATVRNTYKRLYHIGWPTSLKADYSNNGNVLTGGKEQENASHVAELMCASAAYDFFNTNDGDLAHQGAQYVYRTVDTQTADPNGPLRLTGASFVGSKDAVRFENKLGALFSFAHIILSRYSFEGPGNAMKSFLSDIKNSPSIDIHDFDNLTPEQAKEMQKYLEYFAYSLGAEGLTKGWMYQINDSLKNGSFIFTSDAFTTDVNALVNIDPGYVLNDENHQWSKWSGLLHKTPSAAKTFSKFIEEFKRQYTEEGQGETEKEMLLARIYNTLTQLQGYYNE